ncbi:unnamed protein product, partial [Rotaria sp. Silwood2]
NPSSIFLVAGFFVGSNTNVLIFVAQSASILTIPN